MLGIDRCDDPFYRMWYSGTWSTPVVVLSTWRRVEDPREVSQEQVLPREEDEDPWKIPVLSVLGLFHLQKLLTAAQTRGPDRH